LPVGTPRESLARPIETEMTMTLTARRRTLLLAGAAALSAPRLARAQDARIRFVLNFAYDGSTAPFIYAESRGYFREAGIEVQIDSSAGSGDAITRVASGAYQMGIGDMATLVEFTARHGESAPKAVFVVLNRSPSAVISMKAAGIQRPLDLHGKSVGGGAADAPSRLFPAFMQINGVDPARVTRRQVTPQLRDTMLLTRQVDAVTGFDSTVWFNLKGRGTRFEDVNIMYYVDHGLDAYANAILVSPAMLRDQPEVVRRFVRAAARGWREAIADPRAAVQTLARIAPLADLALETERLEWVGQNQVLSADTRVRGIGDATPERLAATIRTVATGFGLERTPSVEEVYDGRFIPPQAERMPLR
jgi:NitT/TauT family transport system substrate-binding protein